MWLGWCCVLGLVCGYLVLVEVVRCLGFSILWLLLLVGLVILLVCLLVGLVFDGCLIKMVLLCWLVMLLWIVSVNVVL